MAADRNRVRDIFRAAVEVSPERRSTFLTDACGGDAELRTEVDRLLAANTALEGALGTAAPEDTAVAFAAGDPETVAHPSGMTRTDVDAPGAPIRQGTADEDLGSYGATATFAQPDPDATTARESASSAARAAKAPKGEGIGDVIAGRYTLLSVIGEGGMGSVYLASQTEPVKRQVALKLIKSDLDSRDVPARFDAERQALALMDHPNIARIYDGGVTASGRPFFVMELVKGAPLAQYCDRRRLTVRARLELFVAVCRAVQHAHHKGIIHRDLKPGNVLVTEVDGRATPKVIDFGVAKATEVRLTDMSLADVGAIVGTPTYMSPEQADPSSIDIDTRTDVYSLGVMLYELLTGTPPINAQEFKRGAILEMLRMVREVEPPRPSTKLSVAEALPNIAANRSIEPARLTKLLRGELDWVVMKSLEKDRNRRYDTVNGFACDIERYLADEVVEARPPSRAYRLKKFVIRNPLQLALAGTVMLLVLSGGTFAWWRDRQTTERKAEARNREQQANQGVDAALKLVPDLRKQYKFDAAKRTLEQAAVLAKGAAPERLAEVEQALEDLEFVERLDDIRYRKWLWITEAEGKGRFNEKVASPAYRQAFEEHNLNLTTLDPAASARRIADSAVKAELVAAVDDWAIYEPEPSLRDRLLEVARRADPGSWTDRLRDPTVQSDKDAIRKLEMDADPTRTSSASLGVLAELMKRRGLDPAPRLTAARVKYPADFELAFLLGLEHFQSQDGLGIGPFEAARALRPENYAVWVNLGELQARKGRLDEAGACLKRAVELDPKLAVAHCELGVVLKIKGELDEAGACFRKAIELAPNLAEAHANLGEVLKRKGQWDGAIDELKKARALNPTSAEIHSSLGDVFRHSGEWDEAIASYERAIALDPNIPLVHSNLGAILCDVKKDFDGAGAYFRKAIALDPKDAVAHGNLGNALAGKGRVDEAIEWYKKAIELNPKYALARAGLGGALNGMGRREEAIASYREAIELDPRDSLLHYDLGLALASQGRVDEAIACYKTAIELKPTYAEAHSNLGTLLGAKGLREEAIGEYEKAIELNPKLVEGHLNLAFALESLGRFSESLEALKRAHELGSKQPGRRYPTAEWVLQAEAKAAMEAKLPEFLNGRYQPRDNQERIVLAEVCAMKKRRRAAAGLFEGALSADSKSADALAAGHRFYAICNAIMLAAGKDEDAGELDDKERMRLRQQGLDWLRADLALWAKLLESDPPGSRRTVAERMNHWKQEPDLAPIREAAALANLTADERNAFALFWRDVDALSKKAENTAAASPDKAAANANAAMPEKAPDDADRLADKAKEAEAHLRAGKPELALPLLLEVLAGRKARLGPDHAGTLDAMNQLGVTYWRLRQFDKSVPLFEELLKLQEAKNGRDHPGTLGTVANLGVNYKDAGRLDEAIPLLEEAHRAAKQFPHLETFVGALTDAYLKAGDHVKGARLLEEQLLDARKELPKDSPQLAGILAQLGLSLLQQKKWTEAEPLLRECLAIREKAQSELWSTFNTQSALGGALLGEKKYAEAEPLLRKGYEGMKRRETTIPPQASSRIPESLDRLIDLYTATEKPEEAKKWRTERSKYPEAAPPKGENR